MRRFQTDKLTGPIPKIFQISKEHSIKMKKQLALTSLLAVIFTLAAAGQTAQGQKQIKDAAEYNAYIAAYNTADPTAKAAAMEAFLQQYPNTIEKEDAMEILMAAYQASNNVAKAADAAARALQLNPNNVRALLLEVYVKRAAGAAGGANAAASLAEAAQLGAQGVTALQSYNKPEGMADADYQKLKSIAASVFHGAEGFGALQVKDYTKAQQELRAAVEANPSNDPSAIQDVYPLALAYLEAKPADDVNGLWFIARAINLSNNNPAYLKYGHSRYLRFHHGEDGWQQLLAQTKTTAVPPADFTIAAGPPQPSPSEQAALMVKDHEPTQMAFSDWEYILSSGNQDAADKVWSAIKGKAVGLKGQVITSSRSKITVAATPEMMAAKTADVEVTLANPVGVAPAVGSTVQFQGKPTSYDASPFLMKMTEGAMAGKAPAAARRPAAKRRRR